MDTFMSQLSAGHNILLVGPGGCGKTFTIQKIMKYDPSIFVTAMTGCAAINIDINATTLHRWAGLGLMKEPVDVLVKKLRGNRRVLNRWRKTKIIITDEISMMGRQLFEKFDAIARIVRDNELPWGGIQLVFSGDFLQLPPVKDDWVFKSPVWELMNWKIHEFLTMRRYNDVNFFNMLLRARKGDITADDIANLKKRLVHNLEVNGDIKPTILFSKLINVKVFNDDQLAKLEGESIVYKAYYSSSNMDKCAEIIQELELKIGAQVMLRVNIGNGLVNGSRGVVEKMTPESVIVQFKHGLVNITRYLWEFDNDQYVSQIPLIHAWALTIHKSQGITLDCAQLDLGGSIFEAGQAYVALSRVRNYDSLYLTNFDPESIFANDEALEYVNTFEKNDISFGEP
jgi:ATP-dependent DNA helicase PIF1